MKYKVSFLIEGSNLADGIELNKANLKEAIVSDFEATEQSYWGNRDLDCSVKKLKIVEVE